MLETVMAYGQIIIADLILSGDNALIIGMAAAGLAPELRTRAMFYGMVIAAVLRIVFAVIATTLLGIPGILFIGSLLLFWVCWRLFQEIRSANNNQPHSNTSAMSNTDAAAPEKTMAAALISITIADVSMSLDNVLAVAAIADGDRPHFLNTSRRDLVAQGEFVGRAKVVFRPRVDVPCVGQDINPEEAQLLKFLEQ